MNTLQSWRDRIYRSDTGYIVVVIAGTFAVSLLLVFFMFWAAGIPWDAPIDTTATPISTPTDTPAEAPNPLVTPAPVEDSVYIVPP